MNGHVFTAEDCGGAIKGNRIDVYVSDHDRANTQGVIMRYIFDEINARKSEGTVSAFSFISLSLTRQQRPFYNLIVNQKEGNLYAGASRLPLPYILAQQYDAFSGKY